MGLLRGNGPGGIFALGAVALVIAVILTLVAGRKDDDRTGTRTQARYVGIASLLALFIALFAFFGVVRSLTNLIPSGQEQTALTIPGLEDLPDVPSLEDLDLEDLFPDAVNERPSYDDRQLQHTIQFGLLLLIAGGVFVFHDRRAHRLAPKEKFPGDATGSVARAALYGACAVALLIGIFAAAKGLYGLFRIIVPGVTGDNSDREREEGIAQMISFLLLAGASKLIFWRAWYWLPEHRD
jgi:hypothetical protein